ncbi:MULTISPECIES: hypothetical protein [Spirulina sp. CCY15215]|uniref:hypothetical protein n=1 Tax=Spirulina sp. CCY15215 TaxID=2767591 RepID=UPI00194EF255|nr:hypothetical protein [Spirulina major]
MEQAAMSINPNSRRPYHKPQLKLYGDIKTLTQSFAVEGIAGDGSGMNAVPNKTN